MRVKRRVVWILVSALALCAAPADAATLRWNVPAGTPAGDYIVVTEQIVTLELIAELGPDELLSDGASMRVEGFGSLFFGLSDPTQIALTSEVDGATVPWLVGPLTCLLPDLCELINQLNPRYRMSPLPDDVFPVDAFHGVIATVDANLFHATIVARGEGVFGAPDAVVRLLLVPEPTSAALLALGLVAFAARRRR